MWNKKEKSELNKRWKDTLHAWSKSPKWDDNDKYFDEISKEIGMSKWVIEMLKDADIPYSSAKARYSPGHEGAIYHDKLKKWL